MDSPTNQLRLEIDGLENLNQLVAFISGLGMIDPEVGRMAAERAKQIAATQSDKAVRDFVNGLRLSFRARFDSAGKIRTTLSERAVDDVLFHALAELKKGNNG